MIILAHALNERLTAGGVETMGQLGRLRELGRDLTQGPYFLKPLPSEAAAAKYSKTLENGIRWGQGRPGPHQASKLC